MCDGIPNWARGATFKRGATSVFVTDVAWTWCYTGRFCGTGVCVWCCCRRLVAATAPAPRRAAGAPRRSSVDQVPVHVPLAIPSFLSTAHHSTQALFSFQLFATRSWPVFHLFQQFAVVIRHQFSIHPFHHPRDSAHPPALRTLTWLL